MGVLHVAVEHRHLGR